MSRRSKAPIPVLVAAAIGWLAFAVSSACGQRSHADYMRERGLEDLYAAYLQHRFERETGAARVETARELAEIYVRLLESTTDDVTRQGWATRATSLLRLVPEADSPQLRMNLARAAYLRAERIAERHRLRMAAADELAEAERVLRDILPLLISLGQESHQRAEQLEAALTRRLDAENEERVSDELAEARRLRSFAFYFAGWSAYYMSVLTDDPGYSQDALRHFGWLVNGIGGEAASLERVQPALLRFEHIARSAVGVGLASARVGRSVEANAWLDLVGRSTDVDETIRAQLPARRVAVFAHGRQWRDLDTLARRWLSPETGEGDPLLARLVAVVALEARQSGAGGAGSELLRRLINAAFADLVASGEIRHIADLAARYGTDLIGDGGFVVEYVRGLLMLDVLESEPAFTENTGAGPAADPLARERWGSIGDQFLLASDSADADRFLSESADARTQAGLALARAGRPLEAINALDTVIGADLSIEIREQAHWVKVIALDAAVEQGNQRLTPLRDESVIQYLAGYPGSERASRLALRPSVARLLTERDAVDILLATPIDSPVYADAQRQASLLLYRQFRVLRGRESADAAERFLALEAQLLEQDRVRLRSLGSDRAADLARAVVLRARRVADAALGVVPPKPEQAAAAIELLRRAASFASIDLADVETELLFRELQIAVSRKDAAASELLLARLASLPGEYEQAGVRLMYRDAVRRWLDGQDDADTLRAIVERGVRVEASLAETGERSAVRLGVLDTVLRAASQLLDASPDEDGVLAAALRAGETIRELGGGDAASVALFAALLQRDGQDQAALTQWRLVLTSSEPGTDRWFAARLESFRLLATIDPEAGRIAGDQFLVLHPDMGPESMRSDFRDILRRLGAIEGGGG